MTSHSPSPGRRANRLARETSPYLLQHAHNPVDWYPWGEEAFAKARAEDKPILLSVGYATCHWCHVMERESFEDEAVARRMAEGFVAIKVDREELPDVDHVYMSALQAISGHGGWPMNMFLTPQLKAFFGGTYFPPRPRAGMSSFPEVLAAVRDAWLHRRAELERQADALLRACAQRHDPRATRARRRLASARGRAARPPLRRSARRLRRRTEVSADAAAAIPADRWPPDGDERARTMLVTTLGHMAAGGMYDHVGGGFARYSTDERWHVPHFEKMLYDNAQLARVYAGAFRLTGDERLRFVAEDTLDWLRREMHPASAPAAYASAQDADAEGVEGKFHVWTLDELRQRDRRRCAGRGSPVRRHRPGQLGARQQRARAARRRRRARRRWASGPQGLCRVGALGARAPLCRACASRVADHRRQGAGRLERHGAARVR